MYSFRYAGRKDAPSIVALVQSAYRGDDSRRGWTTEADIIDGQRTDQEEVLALISGSRSCILLCEQADRLLATVNLQNRGETGYLGMFAVRPEEQGRGLGKLMLSRSEQIVFRDWQCSRLEMTVISLRHDLIDWYRRRGYRLTESFEPFPYGQPRYGLPRRDDLVLQVLCKGVDDPGGVANNS